MPKSFNMNSVDAICFAVGRKLLGLYFLVPGVMKIVQYGDTLKLMLAKGVPLSAALLPVTILLQVGLGLLLILGKQLRISALVLFALTLVINFYLHNFWDLQGQANFERELQNFVKNLGIAAGLLVLASKEGASSKTEG